MNAEHDAVRLVVRWLSALVRGETPSLGELDDEVFRVLSESRLLVLATRHGARHPLLLQEEKESFVRAQACRAAAVRIGKGLDAGSIPWAVIKGLPLAAAYWGDPVARPSVDLDIVVPPDDIRRAEAVLRASALRLIETGTPEWYLRRWSYHVGYGAERHPIVELHWDYLRPGLGPRHVNRLLDTRRPVPVDGVGLPAPSPPWQLIVCAAHASHHMYSLRYLLDVALVGTSLSEQEWSEAIAEVRSAGLGPLLYYAVETSARTLAWRPPAALEGLRPHPTRDRLAWRFLEALPLSGQPSRAQFQVNHAATPLLSCAGPGWVLRVPQAMVTDRGNLAIRIEALRRRRVEDTATG